MSHVDLQNKVTQIATNFPLLYLVWRQLYSTVFFNLDTKTVLPKLAGKNAMVQYKLEMGLFLIR